MLTGIGTIACSLTAGCSGQQTEQPTSATPAVTSQRDGEEGQQETEGTQQQTRKGETDTAACRADNLDKQYEQVDIRLVDGDQELATVTAAVADTDDTRQTGLSETDCLPDGRGMLFVYRFETRRTFWMRNLDFGLDIIFISSEGTISSIFHAEKPADGESGTEEQHRYRGRGQYILEVPYQWTQTHDVTEGDRAEFEL